MRLVRLLAVNIEDKSTETRNLRLITAEGDGQEKIEIWRPPTDEPTSRIRIGEEFVAAADSKGKYSPILPLPGETEITPENTSGAYDRHIAALATKLTDCYTVVQKNLPEAPEETVMKLARIVFDKLCEDSY